MYPFFTSQAIAPRLSVTLPKDQVAKKTGALSYWVAGFEEEAQCL